MKKEKFAGSTTGKVYEKKNVFCGSCGHIYDSDREKCPECGSREQVPYNQTTAKIPEKVLTSK